MRRKGLVSPVVRMHRLPAAMLIRTFAALAACLALAACGDRGCIAVSAPTELYARPHPPADSHPNRVIRQVPPGEYGFDRISDGKDYRAYRIEAGDSLGYVIHDVDVGGPCSAEDEA